MTNNTNLKNCSYNSDVTKVAKQRGRGRPPSTRSHDAIIDAVARILRAQGLHGLTVDSVVAEAKVSKGTVYRLWDSKSAVAIDAILKILNTEIETPDTGSALKDFRSLMRQFAEVLQRGGLGYTYISLLIEAQQNHMINGIHQRLFRERRNVFYSVVEKAIARGELSGDLDRDLLSDMLFGPIVLRLITGVKEIDEEMIEHVLSIVCRGVFSR
jgi:AcrR family transcriptional regulator